MNSFNKLKEWLKIKDDIKLFDRPQRGIYSTKNIKKFDQIIKIKSKYLMEYSNIYKIYPIDDIEEKNSLVAFYILIQYLDNKDNAKQNWWNPYIESFPDDISEYLYYWPTSKLKLLNNTSIMSNGFHNYNEHINSIENDWEIIYDFCQSKEIADLTDIFNNYNFNYLHDLFIRFRILVGSRIFGYDKNEVEESGMVPYIDMINHSFNSNTTWYFDDEQDCFILRATEDIPKGMEIVDDYGDKSNINLLLFYGFTLSNNPFPILRTSITDPNNNIIHLELTLNFNLTNIMNKFESKYNFLIEEKLNQIKNHHEKQLKLFELNKHHDYNYQYNYNIINIYLDEISVIIRIIKQIQNI